MKLEVSLVKIKRYSYNGFFQKKIVPPVEYINFFEVDPPGFPVNFIMTPGIFHFFALTPLIILVFPSNFDISP